MPDTPSTHATGAPAHEDAPRLDAEKLEVYNVALEFQRLATSVLPGCDGVLRDQLRRASVSCVLNLAEGAGRRTRAEKRQFYAVARGSATECAAIVDVLRVEGASPLDCTRARALLVRMVQMLVKLDQSLIANDGPTM